MNNKEKHNLANLIHSLRLDRQYANMLADMRPETDVIGQLHRRQAEVLRMVIDRLERFQRSCR